MQENLATTREAGVPPEDPEAKTVVEIKDGVLEFYAVRPEGMAYRVRGPVLTAEEGAALVRSRVSHFKRYGGRESPEDAMRRRYLAAHGEKFVEAVRSLLDDEGKMELEMMLNPYCHKGPVRKEMAEKLGSLIDLELDRTGKVVSGLWEPVISDNLGGRCSLREE